MSTKKLKLMIILGCFLITAPGLAQEEAIQKLNKGKRYFWEARFDQAIAYLKEVTEMPNVSNQVLFDAYLHLGFVLTRHHATEGEITSAFEEAVRANPRMELDETVIPPDLSERFNEVRNRLVGCLYVTSEHANVNIIAIKNGLVSYNKNTPTLICELVDESYQLIFTERGFEEQFYQLQLTAGTTDTLSVRLAQNILIGQSGGGKWKWLAGGGIVAGAAAVLYTTVLNKSEGGDGSNALPVPPVRPNR
ncbi:hypothetical protein IH970_07565 [candidate division KSB1 bacterium]|nr:hypothetical protein [candidate division KSB1 bacterium]